MVKTDHRKLRSFCHVILLPDKSNVTSRCTALFFLNYKKLQIMLRRYTKWRFIRFLTTGLYVNAFIKLNQKVALILNKAMVVITVERLFDILPNFSFATSETGLDYSGQAMNRVRSHTHPPKRHK